MNVEGIKNVTTSIQDYSKRKTQQRLKIVDNIIDHSNDIMLGLVAMGVISSAIMFFGKK